MIFWTQTYFPLSSTQWHWDTQEGCPGCNPANIFQISIMFTTIHPHQRKRFLFIWFSERKSQRCVLCISSFSARTEDKRHKGITVKKVLLTGIKLGPHRGIICASESRLPCGCSARLIFMSQTDQRQLSLRLCISLSLPFQTPLFGLIFFACVTYCHHGAL